MSSQSRPDRSCACAGSAGGSADCTPWATPVPETARGGAGASPGPAGLEPNLPDPAGNVSHGEQRQLEVPMARATEPTLMLLDEPASGLSRGEGGTRARAPLGVDRGLT